jgi:hypothetical protein
VTRAALIAGALVAGAVLYFAIPAVWYVVPNHFPAPTGIW